MKKLLIIALGVFAFACGDTGNKENETTNDAPATEEGMDAGAGEDVSPQLEVDDDSARLEVDTISTATEANEQKQ
ncbi:hypothetical protein [Pontibacter fetidus]|uniref:Uncharacterized protein n=1 Tax=Pontibacter fetidus TaxID=2700082 RepID=A0A6B2H0H5_9BACT|nr:hypothetical protein [Pontibacter fetidus]NDK55793.1 hypothetical protein [Pontibacter fetidus]